MFKIVNFFIWLIFLAGFSYFTFFVPLGEKNLYQHVVGIFKTSEAIELGTELKKKAKSTADSIPSDITSRAVKLLEKDNGASDADKAKDKNSVKNSASPNADMPSDSEISQEDKKALENIIKSKKLTCKKDKKSLSTLINSKLSD